MSITSSTKTILSDKDIICDLRNNIKRHIDKKTMDKPTDLNVYHDEVDIAALDRIQDEEITQNSWKDDKGFFVKYRGKTYEISSFFSKHPGGRRTLNPYRGLPLDNVLAKVPHSDAAFHLFQEFIVDNRREYDDIENLVDWNEPLLGQVGNLADRYWEWVNLPVDRSIRLFKSDIMEYLTITPWYIVPIFWIPISMYFMYSGIIMNISKNFKELTPEIIIAVSWGLIMWTLIEYVLHRNLFHMKPSPDSKTLITLHFLFHGLHHKAPFDNQRLVFPPAAAALIAVVFYNLYKTLFPTVMIHFIAAGTITGYLCYDLIHYYLHHGNPKAESYLYVMKRYHNYHHFLHHEKGFGISSRFWDFVFGSLIKLKRLKKSIVW